MCCHRHCCNHLGGGDMSPCRGALIGSSAGANLGGESGDVMVEW